MIKIIVMGHGGYAEGVRTNLSMLVGEPDYMHFIDLTKEDDLSVLEGKVNSLIDTFNGEQILFCCDLLGASPFRVAGMLCLSHPGKYFLVTGINTMAYVELGMPSELSVEELADRAIETTKISVTKFPE